MTRLITLVINLDRSTERLSQARQRLDAAEIGFSRVAAADMLGKAPETEPLYDPARAMRFFGRPLTGGEVGCFKSHINCAHRFLASDADFALVLEDDVALRTDAATTLGRLVDWLATGNVPPFDLINMGRAQGPFARPLTQVADRQLCHAFYFPTTTTALMWSRPGAERFLAAADAIYAPVDHFLRKWCCATGRGLAFAQPPFYASGVASEIDRDTAAGARKDFRRGPTYYLRETQRQSRNYLNAWAHQRAHREGSL
jgi:glycosyl transferase, family 25